MNKLLVKFYWDCGRNGHLSGLFVTTQAELESLYGKKIYFGEVLGKHSDIFGEAAEEDFTVKSDDQEFIEKLVKVLGSTRISGYNPFDYLSEEG